MENKERERLQELFVKKDLTKKEKEELKNLVENAKGESKGKIK